MGKNSHVGWTGHTQNFWRACHKVSPGCVNCYMYRDMLRYGKDPKVVVRSSDATFYAPLKWKEPALVFTCSWSDFFIEEADPWRNDAWEVIRKTPHLTYQILTKRPERIAKALPADWGDGWDNVWMGVSVENQKYAEKRIPLLLDIPAQVRFLSCEPLLGPLEFFATSEDSILNFEDNGGIDWIITGGESGPKDKIRPAQLDWFRSIRDQCHRAGIAYFHKQHGGSAYIDGEWGGRKLDGRTWDEYPGQLAQVGAVMLPGFEGV